MVTLLLEDNSTTPYIFSNSNSDLKEYNNVYGKTIPIIYGKTRVKGQLIWHKYLSRNTNNLNNILYNFLNNDLNHETYAHFACAISKGIIDNIQRIWANGELLDIHQLDFTLYNGTEIQIPDSLIAEYEAHPPAFRGLSYIVFKNFLLSEYNGRIPNLEFEVSRNINKLHQDVTVEEKIKSICLIPGSGEFIYDTNIQTKRPNININGISFDYGNAYNINNHSNIPVADAIVSLNNLQNTLPNVEWISVVISWFGNSLDIATCNIYPATEFNDSSHHTSPATWKVKNFNRNNAQQITLNADGNPIYGGTVNDSSLLNFLKELRKRKYKIMLYPIILMDIENKPWRGRLTGNANEISNFFQKDTGYNNFILHYAQLTYNLIDVISIGSELKELTKLSTNQSVFPAVDELINLSSQVRTIISSNTKITYASDWSEYHSVNGIYNMDPLWSSEYIDYIGIDAYFPLTNTVQPINGFTKPDIISAWDSGEGIEYYYEDQENKINKIPFSSQDYAWKNIYHWWNNHHINPDSSQTSWQPRMKKIWFTEFGFPSIDACSNQPNVFIDSESIESKYPYLSNHNIDFLAQRTAIEATIDRWKDSDMVINMFLWTWDARPYPQFPALFKIWQDSKNWETGHWIQGKFGNTLLLSAFIKDLLIQANIPSEKIDVSQISDILEGYKIDSNNTVQNIITKLQNIFLFNIVENNNVISFIPQNNNPIENIPFNNIIQNEKYSFKMSINNDINLPKKIELIYLNQYNNYTNTIQYTTMYNLFTSNNNSQYDLTITLPITLNSSHAKLISENILYNLYARTKVYSFFLPNKYLYLQPSDVVNIEVNNIIHSIKIIHITYNNIIHVQGIAASPILQYKPIHQLKNNPINTILDNNNIPLGTKGILLDIPKLPNTEEGNYIYAAAYGINHDTWKGARLYMSDNDGVSYKRVTDILYPATIGYSTTVLNPTENMHIVNDTEVLDIILISGNELSSIDNLDLINYQNLALLGNEIIQFQNVEKIHVSETNVIQYRLTNILRGRISTEFFSQYPHPIGTRFVLLDNSIIPIPVSFNHLSQEKKYKFVSLKENINHVQSIRFTYQGFSLKIPEIIALQVIKISPNTLSISWNRRSITCITLRDYIDVPLNNYFLKYKIDFIENNIIYETQYISFEDILELQYTIPDYISSSIEIKITPISSIYGYSNSTEITYMYS